MKYDDNFHRADDRPDSSFNKDNRPDKRDLLRRRKSPAGKPSGKPGWSLGHRLAFLFLLVLLGVFLWKQMSSPTADYAKVSYSEFDNLLNTNKFSKIVISENTIRAELKNPQIMGRKPNGRPSKGVETQIGSYDHAYVRELLAKGVEVSIEPERTWVNLLISTIPWIFLIGLWFIFLRQMQGGPKGVFSFGKSKAKLMVEQGQKVTFADVAGVEEAKEELNEIIEFLKDPRKFQRLGGKIPKGALLVGPPGTGKTLLARAVAGEAGVPFFSMSGSDFVEMFVGVGASRVRDLFEQGKTSAPCIIFIDEIDAVGRQRGAGIGGGHDEREQTLNQLLVEMDGFESNDGVILIAATNRPDVLDPALLRPGRFDRQIVVDWPDVKARGAILSVHAKKIQIDPRVDLEKIAKGTPGMTGADLANVVNEAALHAARINRKKVMMEDFEEAKDKVMMGAARKTLVITEEEKRLTAYHEAGHVLVSKFIPGADPVHKVSIVARGRSLGLTHFLPQDERHNWSFNFCMGKLTVLLGGRAAEMVKFTDVTNGASNDIERATNMARKMVCEWGMSKRLGPLTFGKKESEIFLGREIATHKDYSEQTAVAIDQEVRKYVEAAQQRAESIILEHTDKLEALTAEILKKEVLAGDEIDAILKRGRHDSRGHGQAHVQGQRQPQIQFQPQPPPQPSSDSETNDQQPPREAVSMEQPPRERDERRRQRPQRQRRRRAEKPADTAAAQQPGQDTVQPVPSDVERQTEESIAEIASPADIAADAMPSGEAPVKTGSRRRRGSRSRSKRTSGQDQRAEGSSEASVADASSGGQAKENVSGDERSDSQSAGAQNSSDGKKNKGGEGKHKGSVFRERRTKMVNLKTGGRRRFIKKAPAQKIREIN